MPVNYQNAPSSVFTDTGTSLLGQAVKRYSHNMNKQESGFRPLFDGPDAFAARMVLAEAAERSLDIQYYIWHSDDVGKLLMNAVLRAADRGVRVRLLIDDINLGNNDEGLRALDSHPNIELRLFNPFINRITRIPEMVFSFIRINRRMHNKSFTIDNQVSIVGGRNIGDEYYQAHKDVNFVDVDVAAIGPVVQKVSDSFDKYWNSELSVPISDLVEPVTADRVKQLRQEYEQYIAQLLDSDYIAAVKQSDLIQKLKNRQIKLYWGPAYVVYDDPQKVLTRTSDQRHHLVTRLIPLIDDVKYEFLIVSPYFIPGEQVIENFNKILARGVSIKALTNSLAPTDVGLVYSGYAKYRIPMIQAGVELFEIRPEIENLGQVNRKKVRTKKTSTFGSSSRSSLHSKLYVFYRKKIFVGSYNLDSRSNKLNTELGVLFINPELGALLGQHWDNNRRDKAYQLAIEHEYDELEGEMEEKIIWIEASEQGDIQYDHEPLTGFWQRFLTGFLGLLPIEDQL